MTGKAYLYMQNNEYITWIGALGLAIIIHAALLVNISQDWEALKHYSTPAKNITIDFSFITQLEKISTPDKIPATVKPRQKPAAKKTVTPDAKPKETSPTETGKVKTYIPPAPITQSEITQPEIKENQAEPVLQAAEPSYSKNEIDLYLQQLLAHIEKHKYYPSSARRRGLTGEVMIELSINHQGNIDRLNTSGEHRILNQAAKQTIQTAIPLPVSGDTFSYPLELSFNMQYKLK